jgi:hypothetical protein
MIEPPRDYVKRDERVPQAERRPDSGMFLCAGLVIALVIAVGLLVLAAVKHGG